MDMDEVQQAVNMKALYDITVRLKRRLATAEARVAVLEEGNKRLNDLCKDTNDELLDERLKWDRAHGKGKYPQVPVTPIDDAEEPEDDRPERQQYP